jgi:hypothetical protein
MILRVKHNHSRLGLRGDETLRDDVDIQYARYSMPHGIWKQRPSAPTCLADREPDSVIANTREPRTW